MTRARAFHALTFAVAAFAVILQLVLVIRGHQHLGDGLPGLDGPNLTERLVRFWSFLTIWFNIIVAITCAPLAIDPARDGRVWRALRLDGLVLGVGGGLVHWFLLRPILNLHGADFFVDKLLHVVVPVMALIGWLLFGPRRRVDAADLGAFLVVPVVWLMYTLIRGAMVGWYPYPFLDVGVHGYATVSANALAISAMMFGLAAAAMWLDRRVSPKAFTMKT